MIRTLSFVALCAILLFVACEKKSTDTATSTGRPDTQQNDPSHPVNQALIQQEQQFGNVEALTNTTQPADPPPDWPSGDYDVYAVTVIWGSLYNSDFTFDTVDWSGRLEVNRDAWVDVRATIDFENNQDYILPHDNPSFAAWVSFTSFDFDGITALIFLPRIANFTPTTLTFDTEPFTQEWSFGDLNDFMAYYPVGQGAGVVVRARRIWPSPCEEGLISGEWIKVDHIGNQGYLHGLWTDSFGEPEGYLSGTFWTNNDGTREFSGSVSGYVTDDVIAEFSGIWNYDDYRLCPAPWCGTGHGYFRGHFNYINGDEGGSLMGVFGDWGESLAMPMSGVWREHCPQLSDGIFQNAD